MSYFICCHAECHYAKDHNADCRYADCRYADCRGANGCAPYPLIAQWLSTQLHPEVKGSNPTSDTAREKFEPAGFVNENVLVYGYHLTLYLHMMVKHETDHSIRLRSTLEGTTFDGNLLLR